MATLTVTHAMLALLGLPVSDLRVVDHPGLVIATGVWALWMAGWVPEKALTLALWMAAPMLIILLTVWATPFMKKPKRPRDPNQLTKLIVDIA